MSPKVSIIVPMYNMEQYIERCAISLFEQTYKDIEYIFIDDHSQDKTLALLETLIDQYGLNDKVVLIKKEINQGQAVARWDGLMMARGIYVGMVDSDDYVTPEYIEALVMEAEKSSADITFCDYWYDYGEHKRLCKVNPPVDLDLCQAKLMSGEIGNFFWNKLIKRELYLNNDIHPIEGVNMYDDKSVMFQLAYFCKKISYVNQPLYYYNRINSNSISVQAKEKAIEPAIKVVRLIDDFFSRHQPADVVKLAIEYFKVGILGMILFYGNKNTISQNRNLFRNISPKAISKQPVVPFYYKMAVLAYRFRMTFLIDFVRHFI